LHGDKAFVRDYRISRKDGEIRWVQGRGQIFLDAAGKISYISGVLFDVSDYKRAEEAKERLEVQVAQSQKLEALGTLAGGLAHEFNNILWGIMGSAELCIMLLEGGSAKPEKLLGHLKIIMQASERARQLIRQIMVFSRKDALEIRPVRPHHLVAEAVNLLRSTIPKNINIVCETDRSRGSILADPVQIQQIVMNLCTNAYHAMEQEGGVLSIKLEEVIADSELAIQPPKL
jgi:signal transduction histidine kinase